jgi:hypothetical protein
MNSMDAKNGQTDFGLFIFFHVLPIFSVRETGGSGNFKKTPTPMLLDAQEKKLYNVFTLRYDIGGNHDQAFNQTREQPGPRH